MTQSTDAAARFLKLMEGETFRDTSWARDLQEQMQRRHLLVAGRPVSPVVRPHFLTRRQYTALAKNTEALLSAIDRVEKLALATPALLSRIALLPAEKMLASVDPGYPYPAVAALLDTSVNNGTMQVNGCYADAPAGLAYGEILSNLFFDSAPMQELRRKMTIAPTGGTNHFLEALLQAYRDFGGKERPHIAIVETRQPFQTFESSEYQLLAELFRQAGYPTEVVYPEQLEYRNGMLRRGDFPIHVVYRRIAIQDFLLRFELTHPLVRAYREHRVCMVNSFRSELAQKKAIFELLTDSSVTANFPLVERKAIREHLPWTRLVAAAKTTNAQDETVDLPEFIRSHRAELVLRPSEEGTDLPSFVGADTTEPLWDRALRSALKNRYVVQQAAKPVIETFPVYRYGELELRDMQVTVQPHIYLGKMQGCSSWVTALGGFTTVSGLAPTFVVDAGKPEAIPAAASA